MHSPLKQHHRHSLTTVQGALGKTKCLWIGYGCFFLFANWFWFAKILGRYNHGGNVNEIVSGDGLFRFDSLKKSEYATILNDSTVQMDDPKLLEAIRSLLIPPSTSPYNFEHKEYLKLGSNPSGGQVQAVADILRGFGGDGFFLECGANDGEWYSNSIWLEKTLGWKGLLIEADPTIFVKLAKKNRNAWTGHFCLSNLRYPKTLPFYQDKVLDSLGSGLIKSGTYYANTAVQVQCLPLYSVLLAVNRTTVDFFSLDVEGSELDILNTVPFDKVIFKVITIEHVVLREGKVGLRKFMESKGYIFFRTVVDQWFITGDSVFIHQSVKLTPEQQQRIGEEDSLALRLPRA